MPADVVVVGVASSAGTHHAGQDAAPRALREAGLLDRLRAAGLAVEDRGDVLTEVFAVDHAEPTRRNLAAVVRVARVVADVVAEIVSSGAVPLVLGGDCTITLGVVAGVRRHRPRAGLFYFDGDADLATPETTSSGVLDAMGIAHLIGLADTELARIGGRFPILDERRLVLFGVDESDPETFHRTVLDTHPDLRHWSDGQVRADPVGCAAAAMRALGETGEAVPGEAGEAVLGEAVPGEAGDGVVLHFDVDAVDSGDLPLANFPHYGTGVTLDQAGQVLRAVTGVVAVVLTEVNPTYDPGGSQLARYAETVGPALAEAIKAM